MDIIIAISQNVINGHDYYVNEKKLIVQSHWSN